MNTYTLDNMAIRSADDLLFGKAPCPVRCGHGLELGAGTVIPEINFTLPTMDIDESTWPQVRAQYDEMIHGVLRRAVDLEVPGLLVELETLPPMTVRPAWGAEIARRLADAMHRARDQHGLRCALRLTPNDNRDHLRPPLMRRGPYWEGMQSLFRLASDAGADLLAIESTGGKEVSDPALMAGDLRGLVFALGVLAPRDVRFLWGEMVAACRGGRLLPSGDTACGFANTAMVLAEQKMVPRVLAAIVRVASVPRSLAAYEMGAVGPSKDCAYEGPYLKAIAGVPISMEGKSAAGAHLSSIGNIAQAVCDCWSNESIQNVRLLSGNAPTACLEQLAYDCRLMNVAARRSTGEARQLRDWLVESDAALDPQAYVLRPDVVVRLSQALLAGKTDYGRTRAAVVGVIQDLRRGRACGELRIHPRELRWLDAFERQAAALPETEDAFVAEMLDAGHGSPGFLPEEYGILP